PPPEALCRRCRYSLQKLPTNRCPECGLTFDPDDVETMRLETWSGWLARRFLPAAGWPMYVWPAVTAAVFLFAFKSPHLPVPGVHIRLIELWPLVLLSWGLLLIVWNVRAAARVHVVKAYRLPLDRLRRDRRARRWGCACFVIPMLIIAPTTDRCSHGEFWE